MSTRSRQKTAARSSLGTLQVAPSRGLDGGSEPQEVTPVDAADDRIRASVATAVGATIATVAFRGLAARLPETTRATWERTNHAGRRVTLLEGPVWVAAAATGLALGSGLTRRASGRAGGRASGGLGPSLLVVLASGALGALDDLAESGSSKGLKGHLGALRRGVLTTGAVKVVGLAATGMTGALLADHTARSDRRQGRGRVATHGRSPERGALAAVVGGAVIAGAANVANLFDLRPGRALKVVVLCGGPLALAGSRPAAAALGASGGVLRADLAGTSMLGDTGANAAGALIGLALVEGTGLRGRAVALAGLTALTLASEKVSFSKVIEARGALRRLDEWGRSGS